MDDLSISNGTTFGSSPATLLGNKSIEQIQQENGSQYTALADLISTFSNASIGTQNLQDGSVTNEKIANLTFGKAFGGSITIGGNNNGDGIIRVEGSSNNLIIQEDNLGLHLYNSSQTETIRLDNIGLHAFSTPGNDVVRLDNTGLHNYNGASTLLSEFTTSGIFAYGTTSLNFKTNPSSAASGTMGVSGGNFIIGSNNNNALELAGASSVTIASLGTDVTILSNRHIYLSPTSNIYLYGQQFTLQNGVTYAFGLSGSTPVMIFNGNLKTAIVKTSRGYRALYTTESPEVWFCDFVRGKKKRKFPKFWEYTYELSYDPLFLETVEGELIIMETTNKNMFQVWGHRKGYSTTRFEKKTKEQFDKNNRFWNTPNV